MPDSSASAAPAGLWPRLAGRFPPAEVPFLTGEPPAGAPRRLALVLAYDGGAYAGWQVQPGAPSLQGAVEGALSRLCDHPVRVVASGRTDRGVHALGQVAHFDTTSRLATARLARGLAALLPPDILLRAAGPVGGDFHARFAARGKTYEYYLWPAAREGLFLRGRVWLLPAPLDQGPVRAALAGLPGEVEMGVLACQSEARGATRRRILAAELVANPAGGPWRLSFTASGFLRHAVRNLVGALVLVGSRRLAPEGLVACLREGRPLPPAPKAPPEGLYLSRVHYREGEAPPPDPRKARSNPGPQSSRPAGPRAPAADSAG